MTVRGERDGGVVLVNVLAMLALASTVVFAMLTTQGTAIDRSRRFSDAAQALAIAHGGVTSAVVSLRRDAVEAGQIDHAGEPWAALAETEAPIEGGTFTLAIRDAQGRFNVNNLWRGGDLARQGFLQVAATLAVPADEAVRIAALIAAAGPVDDLRDLGLVGVAPETIERLSVLATALPGPTKVNVNAADEALLAVLLGNPVRAGVLVARRDRRGFLTAEDIRDAGVLLPPSLGLASDHFEVDVTARIGGTAQGLTALLQRRREGARIEVVPVVVKREAAAPAGMPPP